MRGRVVVGAGAVVVVAIVVVGASVVVVRGTLVDDVESAAAVDGTVVLDTGRLVESSVGA
ncbi:MAG: hypothetical protein WAS51_05900 [Ilumatobacteraceae bacterium]|nr:MAG: hypothetical protein IPM43_07865 [Actinomycetota bacterium]